MLRRCLLAAALLFASLAQAETVAVIGTGNVGMALGTEFAGLGHTIIYGSRSPMSLKTLDLIAKTGNDSSAALPAEAVQQADIVILAVPGMVTPTVAEGLGDLSGKLIIDATNPLKRVDEGDVPQFEYGVDTSNGQIVQSLHPDAFVVKAFNTIGWQLMIDPGKPRPVMPLAANDAAAKAKVAGWADTMGIDTIDIGGIQHSRVTEHLVVLMLNNRFSDGPKFEIDFRKMD